MADPLLSYPSTYGGNPGRTFYADAAPLRRPPRLRWSAPSPGHQLVGNASLVAGVDPRIGFLDLASGKARSPFKRLPRAEAGYALLAGEVLYAAAEEGLLVLDLASGTVEGPWPLGERGRPYALPGLALWSTREALSAFSVGPGQPAKPAWTFTDLERDLNEVLAAGELVLGGVRLGGSVALDRATGALRWKSKDRVAMADARGAVAYGQGSGYGALDARGGRAWWRSEPRRAMRVLGPDWVVIEETGDFVESTPAKVRLHDRATGKELRVLGSVADQQLTACAAGDVIYAVDGKDLLAWDTAGQELWRYRVPRLSADINYLVAGPGVLLGVTSSSRVFCLEEAP